MDRKLAAAFANRNPDAGLRAANDLARSLERARPDAAASLREGLDEMLIVRRHGVTDSLARTLTSTDPIESMISIGRSTARNVKRRRVGDDQALVRSGDDQRATQLPSRQGLQEHAPPRRRAPTSRRNRHTRMQE